MAWYWWVIVAIEIPICIWISNKWVEPWSRKVGYKMGLKLGSWIASKHRSNF